MELHRASSLPALARVPSSSSLGSTRSGNSLFSRASSNKSRVSFASFVEVRLLQYDQEKGYQRETPGTIAVTGEEDDFRRAIRRTLLQDLGGSSPTGAARSLLPPARPGGSKQPSPRSPPRGRPGSPQDGSVSVEILPVSFVERPRLQPRRALLSDAPPAEAPGESPADLALDPWLRGAPEARPPAAKRRLRSRSSSLPDLLHPHPAPADAPAPAPAHDALGPAPGLLPPMGRERPHRPTSPVHGSPEAADEAAAAPGSLAGSPLSTSPPQLEGGLPPTPPPGRFSPLVFQRAPALGPSPVPGRDTPPPPSPTGSLPPAAPRSPAPVARNSPPVRPAATKAPLWLLSPVPRGEAAAGGGSTLIGSVASMASAALRRRVAEGPPRGPPEAPPASGPAFRVRRSASVSIF